MQSGNENLIIKIGELPQILKDGKAFEALMMVQSIEHKQYVGKYRRVLYDKLHLALGPYQLRSKKSYKYWYEDPTNHVNIPFLVNNRRDERKWLAIVNAMYFALTETLMIAVEDTRQQLAYYRERENTLSKPLQRYIKSLNKAA